MTRVALLTPLGQGAIATVQLVGPDAARIANEIFRPVGAATQGAYDAEKVVLGRVVDEGQAIDQAIFSSRVMKGGRQVVGKSDVVGLIPVVPGEFRAAAEVACHGMEVRLALPHQIHGG